MSFHIFAILYIVITLIVIARYYGNIRIFVMNNRAWSDGQIDQKCSTKTIAK